MIGFITLLLLCQLAGEVIQGVTGVPLPGPVIGMAILFAGLAIRGGVPDGLRSTSRGLLDHLALLFVPAGVGVVLHLPLVAQEWLPIGAALVGSTVLTIAVTALIMRLMLRVTGKNGSEGSDGTGGTGDTGGGARP